VRKSMRDTMEPNSGDEQLSWTGTPSAGEGSHWSGSQEYHGQGIKLDRASADEYESDDGHQWSQSFHQYRTDRANSTSSTSTSGASYDPHNAAQRPFDAVYPQDVHGGGRSESPSHYATGLVAQSAAQASQLARGFARTGTKTSIDTSVGSGSVEDEEVTPIGRANLAAMNSLGNMGPPQITPTRYRDAMMNSFIGSQADFAPGLMHIHRQDSNSERPQVPRLLTGSKMPRPQYDSQGAELNSSNRPLFSAQLDLSGWLEEPVIPSPLYRMGPSLSALQPGLGQNLFPSTPTNAGATAESLRNALAANPPPPSAAVMNDRSDEGHPSSSDTVMQHSNNLQINSNPQKNDSSESQVAARQWWALSSGRAQNDVDVQGVAQACAGHFTLYPALMVLPDATSPVPPLFHRPWLAHSRLHTPTSLARVRVLLAGYHVKLPSSEDMVWELITMETNKLIASYDQHIHARFGGLFYDGGSMVLDHLTTGVQ
jgi:hypothetical protein